MLFFFVFSEREQAQNVQSEIKPILATFCACPIENTPKAKTSRKRAKTGAREPNATRKTKRKHAPRTREARKKPRKATEPPTTPPNTKQGKKAPRKAPQEKSHQRQRRPRATNGARAQPSEHRTRNTKSRQTEPSLCVCFLLYINACSM